MSSGFKSNSPWGSRSASFQRFANSRLGLLEPTRPIDAARLSFQLVYTIAGKFTRLNSFRGLTKSYTLIPFWMRGCVDNGIAKVRSVASKSAIEMWQQ